MNTSSSPHNLMLSYATPSRPPTTPTTPRDMGSSDATPSPSNRNGSSYATPSGPSPTTNTPRIFITPYLYSLLINNNHVSLLNQLGRDSNLSELFFQPDNSTILHLAASLGQLQFIHFILGRNFNLLFVPNCKDDLPIHVAVRACQLEAVKELVSKADQRGQLSTLLESFNIDNNTALHLALESRQQEMAKFLFQKCPTTFYYLNMQQISPLYLAIKAHFWELVTDMLNQNPDAHHNLLAGKSVVHAAIIAKKKDILEMMISASNNDLLYNKTDEMGRAPLSYAAYIGFHEGVKYIISDELFQIQAYKIDEIGYFPIHWACCGGHIKVIKEFFTCLPDSAKTTRLMLTNKGQNILHVAAANGKAEIVEYILQHPELETTMINMKDEDGNTPLHLASKGKHPKVVYAFTWNDKVNLTLQNKDGLTALDIAEDYGDQIPSFEERLTWLALIYAGVPRAPQVHHIHIDMTEPYVGSPSNSVHTNCEAHTTYMAQLNQQGNHIVTKFPIKKRKYKDRINTLLLVATLVATVTFASGFSIPGGYNNNKPEGMATLAHKCAFQVFVISNTIAMYSAVLAAVTLIWAQLDELKLILLSLELALPLLGLALAMMSVAFMSGLYVVLHTVVFWLGLAVLVMGLGFLGALLVFFIPLYSPRCITNKILRNIFHIPFLIMLFACEKGKIANHY